VVDWHDEGGAVWAEHPVHAVGSGKTAGHGLIPGCCFLLQEAIDFRRC
jgi:hypothetical protein